MAIFNSYVKLPEGIRILLGFFVVVNYLRAAAPAADPGKNARRFVMQKSGPLSFSVPFSDTLLLLRTLQIVLVLLIHNGS